ncbi:MAG: hypothetical protein IJ759_04245 [Bacteroidales bacterium]|nr:hypothetical protein [Bacteroidales bacterium]
MKRLSIIVFLLFGLIVQAQKTEADYDDWDYKDNMLRVLYEDFTADKSFRIEKIDCYVRYTSLLVKTVYSQVTAPFGYIGYYWNKKKITQSLEEFYKLHNLDNIENVGNDIKNGVISKDDLKDYFGLFYYNLWLYGDTDDPLVTGGVPKDYKPNMPMYLRRWFYSGLRNPRWNATYINNYSADIIQVKTPYDTRTDIATHNYGTGDTRLGSVLRWYIDENGKWWFFYENTRRTKKNKGKLFYFGAVGLGGKEDGELKKSASSEKKSTKKGRFEFSLNRTVTIDGK